MKILIVDDSDRSEQPARDLVRKGYWVDLARVGWAMSAIMQMWPDIIVLATDGTSVEQTVRESPFLSHMKVVHCHE